MEKETQLESFREYLIEDEKSENTIDNYLYTADLFLTKYGELNKKNMIAFKKFLIDNYSPKTAANRCVAINKFCNFKGKPECKVKSVKIHKSTTVENVITIEQCQKMLDGLKSDGNEKGYWMIMFLSRTGVRVSELIQMDKKCLKKGVFELWTKGKIRKILIPDRLIKESRSYFDSVEGEYLFPSKYGGRMTTRGVAENIKRWSKRYGIPEEVAHPHSFRHLFAKEFLKKNKNIALLSDLLGHESVDTTAIYLRMSEEEQREQFNKSMNW